MLGSAETIEAVRTALDLPRGRAGGARSGDGRRERRAAARAGCAPGAASTCCRGPPSSRRTCSRRGRSPMRPGAADGGRAGGAGARARRTGAALRGGDRRPRRRRRRGRLVLRRRAGRAESRARGIPAARRTARAARTPSALAAHLALGLDPLEAAVAAKRHRLRGGAGRPARHRRRAGPGRRARRRRVSARPVERLRAGGEPLWHNPADEVPASDAGQRRGRPRGGRPPAVRGRGAPDRRVPPPARLGHVGRGARRPTAPPGAARRSWCRTTPRSREGAERVIFFPRAAGG